MKSYEEMLEEFLSRDVIKKCPDAYECRIEHEFNITASKKEKQRKKREEDKGYINKRNSDFFVLRYQ